MAIYILGPDEAGQCCDCARASPCDTCSDPVVNLYCRSRGGTASLIGYSELTTPSSPPKKYLTATFNGEMSACVFFWLGVFCPTPCDPACFPSDPFYGTTGTYAYEYAGSNNYNPTNGNLTIGATLTTKRGANSCREFSIEETVPQSNPSVGGFVPSTLTLTPTEMSYSADAGCAIVGSYFTAIITQNSEGGTSVTLSNEDTDATALARLMNNAEWSQWFSTVSTCSSIYSERTEGFNFTYIETQYGIWVSGLSQGASYNVNYGIYKNTYPGTTEPVVVGTGSHNVSNSSSFSFTGDLAMNQGYSTYITDVRVQRV